MKYLRQETGTWKWKLAVPVSLIVAGLLMMFFLCTSFYKTAYMEAYEVGVLVGYAASADIKAPMAFNADYDQMHGKHFAGIKYGWLF